MLIYRGQTVHSRQQDVIYKTSRLLRNQMTFTVNRMHNAERTVNCAASRSFNFVDRSIKPNFKLTGQHKLVTSLLHFQQSVYDNHKLPVLTQGTKLLVLAEIILQELEMESCKNSRPGSVVSIATVYGLDGPGIEFRWGEIFRTFPDRP